MYKCEICKSLIQRNIKSNKVVIEVRRKKYPLRAKAFKHHGKYIDDPGGTGYEIIKEKNACIECAEKHSR